MKSHDDVELRLRAWMEAAAPVQLPATLLDRVERETGRARQRPPILVRTGLRERRFALPLVSPEVRWMLLALALLAAIAAAVAVGARVPFVPTVDPRAQLVYVLDNNLYVADENGTNPLRIVDGDADAECGGVHGNRGLVSPDGRHIAYRTTNTDACPGTVVIADLDGRIISSVPGFGWDLAWAPDGTRFATWISFGQSIGVYGVDGTLQAELDGSVFTGGDHDPRWTRDGTALLLPVQVDTAGISQALVARLPLDGAAPELVPATDALSIRSASFSPDGTRVASSIQLSWPWGATSSGPDAPRAGLAVTPVDGGQPLLALNFEPGLQIDGGWEYRPVWSPSGDRIAVVLRRYAADGIDDLVQQSADLRVVDATTGHAITVAIVEGSGRLEPLGFSSDGRGILFVEDAGLRSVAIDGSGSKLIVPGADTGAWLPPPANGYGRTP